MEWRGKLPHLVWISATLRVTEGAAFSISRQRIRRHSRVNLPGFRDENRLAENDPGRGWLEI